MMAKGRSASGPSAPGRGHPAQNATKHGLLSRLRPADDLASLVNMTAKDLPLPCVSDSELEKAVHAVAREELAIARIRERQRAADALLAQDLSDGAFRIPPVAASLVAVFDLQCDFASADAVIALAEDLIAAGKLPPSRLDQLVLDRRLLTRYAQEAHIRHRRAMTQLLGAIKAACAEEKASVW